MKFLGKKNAGFSLVELMVVVAIIGILAALAVPRFASFQAKARQSEAKNNLSHMYTLQESYFGDNEVYADVPGIGAVLNAKTGATCGETAATGNAIGFKLTPCNPAIPDGKIRYRYSTIVRTATAFTGQAITGQNINNRVFPRCPTADLWTITEQRLMTDVGQALRNCAN